MLSAGPFALFFPYLLIIVEHPSCPYQGRDFATISNRFRGGCGYVNVSFLGQWFAPYNLPRMAQRNRAAEPDSRRVWSDSRIGKRR
jgi:hypothetical protein